MSFIVSTNPIVISSLFIFISKLFKSGNSNNSCNKLSITSMSNSFYSKSKFNRTKDVSCLNASDNFMIPLLSIKLSFKFKVIFCTYINFTNYSFKNMMQLSSN